MRWIYWIQDTVVFSRAQYFVGNTSRIFKSMGFFLLPCFLTVAVGVLPLLSLEGGLLC